MTTVTRKRESGRPKKLSEQQINFIVTQFNSGDTQRELAERYNVSVSTIRRALDERRPI